MVEGVKRGYRCLLRVSIRDSDTNSIASGVEPGSGSGEDPAGAHDESAAEDEFTAVDLLLSGV